MALVGHAHEGASGGACQYAVGVYNKRKGTLTICPADCDMTRVEVRVPGANYAAEEAPSSRATDDANKLEERREKTKALVAEVRHRRG